jgi:hypothetical protein
MRELTIDLELWSEAWWRDARTLAEAHFQEVDGGVEPRRRFKLDERLMGLLDEAGSLKILSARLAGEMIGYFTWNITPDVESEGLIIAQQGAWYVAPGNPGVGAKMFDRSVQVLKQFGVQCIFPHHRVQGRGSHIGRFFESRGAKLIQYTFCLWIGDDA